MTAPAWHPDPTGRHELRYWDGGAWSDHVSDGGVTGSDPVGAPPQQATTTPAAQAAPVPAVQEPTATPPEVAHAPTPAPAPAPAPAAASTPAQAPAPTAAAADPGQSAPAPFPMSTAATPPDDASSKLPFIIGGLVAVVVLAAAAFFLLGGDDGGRDVEAERAGLDNLLDDNNAPNRFDGPTEDIGDCPFDFELLATELIFDADNDASDVDPDANLATFFTPPSEPTLSCGVFVDVDDDEGYFVDIYASDFGAGNEAQDLVDIYNELAADTDVDIDLTDLGKAAGGTMFRACADRFLLPDDDPDDFLEDPYCDTVWVNDGLVIGLEQFGSQSIGAEDAKAILLASLEGFLLVLAEEA